MLVLQTTTNHINNSHNNVTRNDGSSNNNNNSTSSSSSSSSSRSSGSSSRQQQSFLLQLCLMFISSCSIQLHRFSSKLTCKPANYCSHDVHTTVSANTDVSDVAFVRLKKNIETPGDAKCTQPAINGSQTVDCSVKCSANCCKFVLRL